MAIAAIKHVPNAISLARLCCVPVLAWLAWSRAEQPFVWLTLAALFSDGVDGWVARRFDCISRLGSMLDSIADATLMGVIGYGTWAFHPVVFTEYGWLVALVVGLWLSEHALAFLRYGRPSSFHTALTRFGVAVFALFVTVMFVFGFQPWLFFVTVAVSILAVAEQLAMLWLLPQWTPDLRGGLPEAWRRTRVSRQA
ncbi:MAG: CDP-alcohol phosphatidyltransferase family protein [Gammaproteobacteria bacterium]